MSQIDLPAHFDPVSAEDWRAIVERDLKGAPFDKKLVTPLLEGISLQPLYDQAADRACEGRPAGRPWRVVIDSTGTVEQIWIQLREELARGADAVRLLIGGHSAGEVVSAIREVDFSQVDLTLVAHGGPDALGAFALTVARELTDWRLHLALDPLAAAARGELGMPIDDALAQLGKTVAFLRGELGERAGRLAEVSSTPFHGAGADEATDLGLLLAAALEVLRALDAGGTPPAEALRHVTFRVPLPVDVFLAIAKLRAFRALWRRALEVAEVEFQPAWVLGISAWRDLTRRDPWVNLLRGTLVGFAGAVGGADGITIAPFDRALGRPEPLGRRIARNTHSILREESHLAFVADPARGSYAVESLTGELQAQAWGVLREVEEQGGLAAALRSGWVAERCARTRARRAEQIAKRKLALTGLTDFPLPGEEVPQRASLPYSHAPKGGGDVAPLPLVRLAEPFEALRDASDAALAERGARPRAFLAALGPLPEHTGRTTWIRNLLAAGGIEAVGGEEAGPDPGGPWELAGAKVAILSGSDARYADEGAAALEALRAAGAARVLVAGRPGALEEPLRAAGASGFLYLGQDVLAELSALSSFLLEGGQS